MALRQILTEPNKILREKSITVDKVDADLKKLMELDPEHISAYSLTVEPSTKLFNLVRRKELLMPLEKIDIEQFSITQKILSESSLNSGIFNKK